MTRFKEIVVICSLTGVEWCIYTYGMYCTKDWSNAYSSIYVRFTTVLYRYLRLLL